MAAKKSSNGASSTAAFDARVQEIITGTQALIAQLAALGLPTLTSEERLHANGRLRDGEEAALLAILDTIDASPGVFQALAARDGGTDDAAVETAPARAALAHGEALQPLATLVAQLAQAVSDGMLASFTQVKDVTVPAYAIGKVSAASDASVRKTLAPALSFYGAQARKRTLDKKVKATRAAKAAKSGKAGAT